MKILSSYKKPHTADTQPTANTQCSSSSLADDRNDDEDIDVMLDQNNFEQVDIDFDSDAVNSLAVRTERASPTRKRRPAASSSDPDDNRTPAIIAEKRSKREQLSEDEDDDSENGIYRRQYGWIVSNALFYSSPDEDSLSPELYERLAQQEAKMQKLLETVTKRVYSSSQNEDSIQPDPSIQLPKMPIKDAQVLARLNTQLANPAIMDQMVCVCAF